MRRKDREITEASEIAAILSRCEACRLGLDDEGKAYIVPMNFGFTMEEGELTLYFHCAGTGRKLTLLRKNPRVCFEADCGHEFLPGDAPSDATFAYECVMGTGLVEEVEDPAEKKRALDLLMEHYTGRPEHIYTENCLKTVTVLRLRSRSFTAKRHPKPAPDFSTLVNRARKALQPRRLSEQAEAGGVGAALLTEAGNVYVGVCIDTACSMGFCAEHAAAAAMVTAGENRVVKMVAVDWDGSVLPPCGRCREFISQLHPDNAEAEVMVREDTVVKLGELLPHSWRE